MLIAILLLTVISTAVTREQEKSILYSRAAIQGLLLTAYISYINLYLKPLDKGIGVYNGLFNVTTISQSFNIFILIVASIIIILTAFFPRRLDTVSTGTLNLYSLIKSYKDNNYGIPMHTLNKNSGQFTIIEYPLVITFILLGAIFLMSTGDLVSLFLSIELQSYGLYILATLYRNSESATNSGLTYFLLGGLSSCFILLGSAILYVSSGTTLLDNIYIINSINEFTNISSNIFSYNSESYMTSLAVGYINFSLIILTVGFLFKISAAPFHFWSPDVYDGIPTIVTTFVAIVAKISIFILMLELVSYTDIEKLSDVINPAQQNNIFYLEYEWKNILILSSLMSLIVGSLLGLTQYRIKRLFAYSTISHVGFILLALSINKIESIQGYIFYIIQYSLSNLNSFIIIIVIGYTLYNYVYTNKDDNDKSNSHASLERLIDAKNSPIQLLNQLKGYFHLNAFLAISLAITLFSFVGIPPLIGFFAKQMVLSAALDGGYVFMTLVGVITSVIGAVYYLNMIKLLFFSKSDYIISQKHNTSTLHNVIHEGVKIKQVNNNYINDGLSATVSILTMIISLFIFVPGEWFRIVIILSLPLY